MHSLQPRRTELWAQTGPPPYLQTKRCYPWRSITRPQSHTFAHSVNGRGNPSLRQDAMENSFALSACLPEDGITSSHDAASFPRKDRNLAASLSEGTWANRSPTSLLAILVHRRYCNFRGYEMKSSMDLFSSHSLSTDFGKSGNN